ncbi:MAG: STAS/SEC14 domain-containing protein [Bacteroidales bacterium]|nr:STAS/SEC14 domain-containing protein [Bacteroidales bacterium]
METNRFDISFDDINKIIIYKHYGILSIDQIGEAWQSLLKTEQFLHHGYNLLSDYTEADFGFSVNSTEKAWSFFHSIQHILDGKKEAVVTSTPLTTAISVLFEHETLKELNFEVKTFSTKEVAIDWLLK